MGKPADLVILVQVYFQRETSDTYKHMSVETVTVQYIKKVTVLTPAQHCEYIWVLNLKE